MAWDSLVNPNDSETIKILLKKGLLVYDGTFKLMNKSFREFILSSIDPDDLKHYMSNLPPKWKRYKARFSVVVLGLVVFFAFQGNLLNEVNALITSIIGALAILTKFSGVLSGFSIFKKG